MVNDGESFRKYIRILITLLAERREYLIRPMFAVEHTQEFRVFYSVSKHNNKKKNNIVYSASKEVILSTDKKKCSSRMRLELL